MKWRTFRRDVQRRWERLTDGDLEAIDGDYDRLRAKLRERYGFSDHDLDKSLVELDKELKDLNAAPRRMGAGE